MLLANWPTKVADDISTANKKALETTVSRAFLKYCIRIGY